MSSSDAVDMVEQSRMRMSRPPRKKNWRFVQSLVGALANHRVFRDVETFCSFIGYPRSGHTLIGSLLDAHPEAVIADELDALRFIQAGFSRRQVVYLMMRNSRNFAAAGRERTGYPFVVPGQWQGRFAKLRVIGDKFGGVTATRLRHDPHLLDSLPERLLLKIKFVHVLRNPYDVISTLNLRTIHTLERAVQRFFFLCEAITYIKSKVPQDVFDLRHEEFLTNPKMELQKLCAFVGLTTTDEYLDACASIVYRSPHKSRDEITWPENLVESVARAMKKYDFLAGYSYES